MIGIYILARTSNKNKYICSEHGKLYANLHYNNKQETAASESATGFSGGSMLPAVVAAVDLALELLLKQADKGMITTWSSVSAWIHFLFNTLRLWKVCSFTLFAVLYPALHSHWAGVVIITIPSDPDRGDLILSILFVEHCNLVLAYWKKLKILFLLPPHPQRLFSIFCPKYYTVNLLGFIFLSVFICVENNLGEDQMILTCSEICRTCRILCKLCQVNQVQNFFLSLFIKGRNSDFT